MLFFRLHHRTLLTSAFLLDSLVSCAIALLISGNLSFLGGPAQPPSARAQSIQASVAATVTAQPVAPTASSPSYPVVKVIKGHEIVVRTPSGDQHVRMVGIAAPDLSYGNQPSQCYALEAAQHTTDQLLGKTVTLVADSTQPDKDDNGRLLRYVFVEGSDYQLEMVQQGYAHEFTFHSLPHPNQRLYQVSQGQAEHAKRGFWNRATCNGNTMKPGILEEPSYFRSVTPTLTAGAVTCASFRTHNEAQRFYEAHLGPYQDTYRLDPQRIGRACEQLP